MAKKANGKKVLKKATKKATKKQNTTVDLFKNVHKFIEHIDGLQKATNISMVLAIKLFKKEKEDLEKYIEDNAKKLKKDKNNWSFVFDVKDQSEYEKLETRVNHTNVALKMLPRSLFVSMVSQFDLLVAELMREVLEKYPNIISKEKNLSYEEIVKLNSIKQAKEYFVEDEIDSVLRGDHAGHIEWFERKIGIELKKHLKKEEWCAFIELTERRNLYVHADGIVSQQYVKVLSKNDAAEAKKVKIGDVLDVSPEYLEKIYKDLYLLSLKLAWLVSRKIESKKIEKIDSEYINLGASLISEGKFSMSENLLEFVRKTNFDSRELEKNYLRINMALAMKLSGKKKEALELLDEKDWSSTKPEFELAVCVIRGKHKEALSLMEVVGDKSKIVRKESYDTDPIYADLRKQKGFSKVYKKIFGEEFVENVAKVKE